MAKQLTANDIEPKAISASSDLAPCTAHADCRITRYATANLFRAGDKAHRMTYTLHSAEGTLRGGSAPYCGSKKYGYAYFGQLVDAVTCGRC